MFKGYFSLIFALVGICTGFTSCGPSEKEFEGKDFVVTGPSSLTVRNRSESQRGAMYSNLELYDEKTDASCDIEVVYACLNPAYLLEDSYGGEIERYNDSVFVSCNDFGNVYSFNQDSCTVVVCIGGDSGLAFDDFRNWKVSHDYKAAAARCDKHPENDRPFLYEAYGVFSSGIDYAITDDNITMRSFKYVPESNSLDVTIFLRNKTRDGYMAHKDGNDEYIMSRVREFANGTGLYHTYCRSKGADLNVSVYDTFGEPLPVLREAL